MTESKDVTAAVLVTAARLGLPVDVQELLLYGDASRGIKPGILGHMIAVAYREMSQSFPMDEAPTSGEEVLAVDSDGNWRVVFFAWEDGGKRFFQRHGGQARSDYQSFVYLPDSETVNPR